MLAFQDKSHLFTPNIFHSLRKAALGTKNNDCIAHIHSLVALYFELKPSTSCDTSIKNMVVREKIIKNIVVWENLGTTSFTVFFDCIAFLEYFLRFLIHQVL